MALSRYEEFRRAVRDLGIVAKGDLDVLWRSVRDKRDAKQALFDLLPELTQTYSLAAGSLAADFYDQLRDELAVSGTFRAIVPDPKDLGTEALVKWALSEAQDSASFQALIEGGFQKRISNGARSVVMTSSYADPHARGWMRIGGAGECDFCAMLVSRGAVYRTEATADFAPHDHCNCGAAPAWDPQQIKAVRSEYVPSARRRSDQQRATDNARVRAWISDNL
jgi:hypothetical protein